MVAELLDELELTRFSNSTLFCILVMNAADSFPRRGRPADQRRSEPGGRMAYIASFELKPQRALPEHAPA